MVGLGFVGSLRRIAVASVVSNQRRKQRGCVVSLSEMSLPGDGVFEEAVTVAASLVAQEIEAEIEAFVSWLMRREERLAQSYGRERLPMFERRCISVLRRMYRQGVGP